MSAPTKTNWYMTGEELVTCNCARGCPCQFNYQEAEMGNAVMFQVAVGSDLRMDYANTYAQLNRFEWRN